MNTWVTGGGGWLGSRLLEVLASEGHRVKTLLLPGESAFPGVQTTTGDVRNPDVCRRFLDGARDGLVIHLAGVIHPRGVKDFYEVNLDGTRNVVEAARAAGVRRTVVMSSSSPCGCNPHAEHRFDESSPYRPYMGYGRSKMQMEQYVRAQSDLDWVLVRAPWFYGPNQPARQTTFFKMIQAGRFPLVGDGHNQRSMSYIDNLCDGLRLASTVPEAARKIYWIADERPYSMSHIVTTVQELLVQDFGLPVKPNRLRLPWIAGEVATLADGALQSLGLYQQKIHVLSELNKTIACSVERANVELGYNPAVELREGMRRSIAWCLSRGYLQ
jgi:nucleoside-diphosphate-sugar epimerase